jgi:hypothetical protein
MKLMKRLVSKNPLFFAFFFPAVTDGVITLLGQDPSYWTNRVVNEASPAYYLLLISPWLFGIGSIFWLVFWYWIFKKLKEPLNLFFMFLFVAGHSWGSSSWIWKIMRVNGIYSPNNRLSIMFAWSVTIIYLALIAVFATYCLRIYMRRK